MLTKTFRDRTKTGPTPSRRAAQAAARSRGPAPAAIAVRADEPVDEQPVEDVVRPQTGRDRAAALLGDRPPLAVVLHYEPRPGARALIKRARAAKKASNRLLAAERRREKQARTIVRRLRRAGQL